MWIQQYYVKQLQFEQWSDTSLNIVQYFYNNFDRGNAIKKSNLDFRFTFFCLNYTLL